jgi:C4-type Zn-finger protein
MELIPLTLCQKRLGEAPRSLQSSEFESRENSRKVESVRISSGKVGEVGGSLKKAEEELDRIRRIGKSEKVAKIDECWESWQKLEECRKRNRGNRTNSKIDERL